MQFDCAAISSVAGATSGLLGLTNASGFLFYTLTSILAGVAFSLINCRRAPGLFFVKGGREVALSGLLDNLFPFVLFWTREHYLLQNVQCDH